MRRSSGAVRVAACTAWPIANPPKRCSPNHVGVSPIQPSPSERTVMNRRASSMAAWLSATGSAIGGAYALHPADLQSPRLPAGLLHQQVDWLPVPQREARGPPRLGPVSARHEAGRDNLDKAPRRSADDQTCMFAILRRDLHCHRLMTLDHNRDLRLLRALQEVPARPIETDPPQRGCVRSPASGPVSEHRVPAAHGGDPLSGRRRRLPRRGRVRPAATSATPYHHQHGQQRDRRCELHAWSVPPPNRGYLFFLAPFFLQRFFFAASAERFFLCCALHLRLRMVAPRPRWPLDVDGLLPGRAVDPGDRLDADPARGGEADRVMAHLGIAAPVQQFQPHRRPGTAPSASSRPYPT
jgi:hypothetical protein